MRLGEIEPCFAHDGISPHRIFESTRVSPRRIVIIPQSGTFGGSCQFFRLICSNDNGREKISNPHQDDEVLDEIRAGTVAKVNSNPADFCSAGCSVKLC
jgi:hypothetical protein